MLCPCDDEWRRGWHQAVFPCLSVTSSETGFGVQELRQLVVQSASLELWSAFPEDDKATASKKEVEAIVAAGVEVDDVPVGRRERLDLPPTPHVLNDRK